MVRVIVRCCKISELNRRRYILAGILTAMIFVLGLLIGVVVEGKRVQLIQDVSQESKVDIGSLQLQYAFMDQLSQVGNCVAFEKGFNKNLESLETARIKLANYQSDATVNRREFELLQRNYIISQVEYMLLSMKAKSLCKTDVVNVVYFFSKKCDQCDDQSFLLSFLKQKFGDRLFLFGFDTSFDKEPLLNLLVTTYNVQDYPTLIIEDKKHVGFMSKENLTSTICAGYKNPPQGCTK